MPKPSPKEFRADVIAVDRKGDASMRQVASDFGISETCLKRWIRIADREDGIDRGVSPAVSASSDESVELREAHKRIKLLEQEAEVMSRAVGYLSQNINPNDVPAGP